MVSAIIDRHVGEWIRRPFTIGSDDCAFAVRAILEEAGATTVYQNRVGEFRTAADIDEFIASETGGAGLASLIWRIARQHGWRRIRASEAGDGDIVVFRGPDREPCLGIVRGPMVLTRANPGVLAFPKGRAVLAFKVHHGRG